MGSTGYCLKLQIRINSIMIYLGKISNHVASSIITFTQNVKQKEVNVIVKGLVIKKQFCQITKVLSINFVLFAVNLFNIIQ